MADKKRRKILEWIDEKLYKVYGDEPSLTPWEEALTSIGSLTACPSLLPSPPIIEQNKKMSNAFDYPASCTCAGPIENKWFITSCRTSNLLRYYTSCLRAVYSTSFNTKVERHVKDRSIDFAPIKLAISTPFSEAISPGLAPFIVYTFGCYLLCRGEGSFPQLKMIRAAKIGALDWGLEFLDTSPTLSNLTPRGSKRWAMSAEGFTRDACALGYHLMCAGRHGDDLYSSYECMSYFLPHELSISQTLSFIQLDCLGDFYYGPSGEFHFTPVRTYASFWCMILHGIVDFGRDQCQREKKAALRLIAGNTVLTQPQWEGILATAQYVWIESCTLWEAGIRSPALTPPLSVLYCAAGTAQREYHLDILASPSYEWVSPSTPTKRYSSDPTTLLEAVRSGRYPDITFDDTTFRSRAATCSDSEFAEVKDMAAQFGSLGATREGCLAFDDLIIHTLNRTCRSHIDKAASDYGIVCYYSLYEWFRGWVNLARRGPPLAMVPN